MTHQYTIAAPGGSARVKQDFTVLNSYAWTPIAKEGNYTITVTARDLTHTTLRGTTSKSFVISTALISGAQAVHTTNNSMVALFSAPPCPASLSWRVVFFQEGSTVPKSATNDLKCDGSTTMNVLVAGMYANSQYSMFWQTRNGNTSVSVGKTLKFTTGGIPAGVSFPPTFAPAPTSPFPAPPANDPYPVVIEGIIAPGGNYTISATDVLGKPIWVLPYVASLFNRTAPGGEILYMQTPLVQTNPVTPNAWAQQLVVADLAGNQTQQTNASIMSEQLVAMGKHPITGFHHESIKLPNGGFLTLGNSEQLVTNANQCGTGPSGPNTCDVLGDTVMVLDNNLQLLWAWDVFKQGTYTTPLGTFNLLDTPAVLGETCAVNGSGCPPFFLAPTSNDWMHTNALQMTADGNILVAVRHIDQILKINYGNGTGDGHIMWRMGKGGDFALTTISTVGSTADPDFTTYPWFSHSHDAGFSFGDTLVNGVQILTLWDNGNTRIQNTDPNGHSRIQVYAVNEAALQMNLNTDIDSGYYSFALGTAQFLPNGNLWGDAGAVGPKAGPWAGYSVEADSTNGSILYVLQMASGGTRGPNSFLTYRTFRLPSLYAASF